MKRVSRMESGGSYLLQGSPVFLCYILTVVGTGDIICVKL